MSEPIHPWDELRHHGGGCDVYYQCPASSFIEDGYEWRDGEPQGKWWKDGRPLWICECWRRLPIKRMVNEMLEAEHRFTGASIVEWRSEMLIAAIALAERSGFKWIDPTGKILPGVNDAMEKTLCTRPNAQP